MVMAVPAMHDDMHQRARKQNNERQGGGHMGAVPDDEITTEESGGPKDEQALVSGKTPEHDQAPS